MPRLPTDQQLGDAQVPGNSRPVFGVNAGASQGAAVQAAASQSRSALDLGNVGSRMMEAEARISARQEAVDRVRVLGEYEKAASAELTRLQTEDDISKVATTNAYGTFLSDSMKKAVEGYSGTPEGKAMLAERLEATRFGLVGQAANLATQAQRKLLESSFGDRLGKITSGVSASPGNLPAFIQALDKEIADMAPALAPEDEAKFLSIGRKEIALSALNSFVARGDAKNARDILNTTPGMREMLGPEGQRRIDAQLIGIEQKADEMRNAGLRKLNEASQILGRNLTMAERMKLAGVGDADKDKSPAAKLGEMESALGRPLTEAERTKALGVYIEQKGVNLSDVAGMRKEFTNQSGDFIKVRDAYNKISATASNPSPAGDMALIFNYMKMLDPGSTVREGEYATAQNAGSIPDRVWAQYNKAVAGESLAPPQRSDFLKQSKNLYDSQLKTQKALEKTYKDLAARAGFNPDDVAPDLASQDPGGVSGPAESPVIQYGLGGQRIGAAKK